MNIRLKLSERRKELGLTLAEVAAKVGVSEATVSRWESGHIDNMKRDKIALLADALKVSPLYVMGMESKEFTFSEDDVTMMNAKNDFDPKEETDIEKLIDNLKQRINIPGITFKGQPVTPEEKQAIINGIQIGLEIAMRQSKEK